MRVLIHGLQSSGATLFAYCLSQNANILPVLDVHVLFPIDRFIDVPQSMDIVAKCTVSTYIPFNVQKTLYKPDITILFNRDSQEVRDSLRLKYYRDEGGSPDAKISIAEKMNPSDYDYVLSYDSFLRDTHGTIDKLSPLLEWLKIDDFYGQKRTLSDMADCCNKYSSWCRTHWNDGFGFGNARLPIVFRE